MSKTKTFDDLAPEDDEDTVVVEYGVTKQSDRQTSTRGVLKSESCSASADAPLTPRDNHKKHKSEAPPPIVAATTSSTTDADAHDRPPPLKRSVGCALLPTPEID